MDNSSSHRFSFINSISSPDSAYFENYVIMKAGDKLYPSANYIELKSDCKFFFFLNKKSIYNLEMFVF